MDTLELRTKSKFQEKWLKS